MTQLSYISIQSYAVQRNVNKLSLLEPSTDTLTSPQANREDGNPIVCRVLPVEKNLTKGAFPATWNNFGPLIAVMAVEILRQP